MEDGQSMQKCYILRMIDQRYTLKGQCEVPPILKAEVDDAIQHEEK